MTCALFTEPSRCTTAQAKQCALPPGFPCSPSSGCAVRRNITAHPHRNAIARDPLSVLRWGFARATRVFANLHKFLLVSGDAATLHAIGGRRAVGGDALRS